MSALLLAACIYALLLIQVCLPSGVQDSFFFLFLLWESLLILSFIPACIHGFRRRQFFSTGLALVLLLPILCVLITLCLHGAP